MDFLIFGKMSSVENLFLNLCSPPLAPMHPPKGGRGAHAMLPYYLYRGRAW